MNVIRTSKEDIIAYEQSAALNQSSIKHILKQGMQSFLKSALFLRKSEEVDEEQNKKKKEDGDVAHFIIGKGVDTLITGHPGDFDEKYFISSCINKPTEKPLAIVKNVYDKVTASFPPGNVADLAFYRREIYDACNEVEFFMNRRKPEETWNDDSRINTIITGCAIYFDDLCLALTKQVISQTEKNIIEALHNSFLNHPNTGNYFQPSSSKIIIYQMPLYFTYEGVECKALLDMVIIDLVKGIIRIIDLKTIGRPVLEFIKQCMTLRYDIQSSFYSFAMKENIPIVSQLVDKNLEKFKVVFAFMAESTRVDQWGTPLIFPMHENLLFGAEHGIHTPKYHLPGWNEGVTKYRNWMNAEFNIDTVIPKGVIAINDKYEYALNV